MVHGSERISWWICTIFNFCTLNNLTRKWLRNEHCQAGLLHLLKNPAESRDNCKWKKETRFRSKPKCLTWTQSWNRFSKGLPVERKRKNLIISYKQQWIQSHRQKTHHQHHVFRSWMTQHTEQCFQHVHSLKWKSQSIQIHYLRGFLTSQVIN